LATGCPPQLDAGAPEDASAPHEIPQWDGCDVWAYLEGARGVVLQSNGGISVAHVAKGYVANGTLVASAAELELDFAGPVPLNLTDALITAEIEVGKDGKQQLTHGILTGRAEISSLVSVLGNSGANGQLMCNRGDIFLIVQSNVCVTADLP